MLTRLVPAALVALLAFGTIARAAPPDLSADDFKLWKDYVAALEDERVQKMPEGKRLGAIARNFRVKEADLKAAIAKGEATGPGVAAASEAEVRALIDATALKGRVSELRVDDSASHVVTYFAWKNVDGTKLEEEASLAALLAAKGAPVTSTVALWAVDAASGRKVFEAKISAESARKFQESRIAMFAAARYIRQFQDVKNAYKGTPPAQTN